MHSFEISLNIKDKFIIVLTTIYWSVAEFWAIFKNQIDSLISVENFTDSFKDLNEFGLFVLLSIVILEIYACRKTINKKILENLEIYFLLAIILTLLSLIQVFGEGVNLLIMLSVFSIVSYIKFKMFFDCKIGVRK